MTSDYKRLMVLLGTGMAVLYPAVAQAQSIAYGNVSDTGAHSSNGRDRYDAGSADDDDQSRPARSHSGGRKVKVTPYIEAQQVAFADLTAGGDVLTYSVLSAGVDATIAGRNNQASISARYERRFGWGNARDNDAYSGLARASVAVVPQTVQFETGAIATRTAIASNGAAITGSQDFGDSVTQVYSIYAGPQLATRVGNVGINGSYRVGYTRVDTPDVPAATPGRPLVDVFDDSISHHAALRAGIKPGEGESAVRDFMAKSNRRHAGLVGARRASRRVNAVPLAELRDIVGHWADAALELREQDLKLMQRLAGAQSRLPRAAA